MTAPRTTLDATSLAPAEAIAFLRQKVNVTSQRWTDIWQEAHSRSFMVAGAASQALVQDFRDAVHKAIEQGSTLVDFRRDFDRIVAEHGWVHNGSAAWRSQIILETNLSTAYSAGRYARMTEPDTLRVFPYWQYQHTSSARPRPQHLAWVGTTLPADDPWWSTHYPPNGWRCRCGVRPVSQAGLGRMGKSGPDPAPPVDLRPWRNPHTGEVLQVPHGIDPGFGYNPGRSWQDGTPPPGMGGPVAPPAPRPPRMPPAEAVPAPAPAAMPALVPPAVAAPDYAAPDYAAWLDRLVQTRRPDGSQRVVGEIQAAVLRALSPHGPVPPDPAIVIRASDVLHITRGSKAAARKGIALDDLRRLPALLAAPVAVLRARDTGELLYVFMPSDPAEARRGKFVLRLGLVLKGRKAAADPANAIVSAGLVPDQALLNAGAYEVLDGSL